MQSLSILRKKGGESSPGSDSTRVSAPSAADAKTVFTAEQLSDYDGVRSPEIYIAINGIVWDVTDKVSCAVTVF